MNRQQQKQLQLFSKTPNKLFIGCLKQQQLLREMMLQNNGAVCITNYSTIHFYRVTGWAVSFKCIVGFSIFFAYFVNNCLTSFQRTLIYATCSGSLIKQKKFYCVDVDHSICILSLYFGRDCENFLQIAFISAKFLAF